MQQGVEVLLEACVKLECTVAVRIRALVLYHHFMRCSSQKSVLGHNDIMVAAAALKCAGRYEEENLDYDTLVLLFYCIVNKTEKVYEPDEPEFMAIKKSLITVDHIMQRKLEYIFSHRLAHQFLVPFLSFVLERNFRLAPYHQSLSEATMKFANDMYTDPLCINYKPDHLAIACIHAALHVHGLLKDVDLLEPWFQAFSRDLTVNKLREIKIFLLRLYNSEKMTAGDTDTDSGVVAPENSKEQRAKVQEKHDEEIILLQEVDRTKQIDKGKKKQYKRKREGKSKKRLKGVGKRNRSIDGSKHDGRFKNEHEGNKSENLGGDECKINENETDICISNQKVGEKSKEEDEKKQEKKDDGVRNEEGSVVPNIEGSQKGVEDTGDRTVNKESSETVEKEPSSNIAVSTLDLELSVWAARFKAAREFNCSVSDVGKTSS